MINNTKINYGFYNFSFGEAPDKVYAIALCRGDASPSECRSCISGASSDLLKAYPNQKEAIIWPNKCSLRYSNRSIFNAMEASPLFAFYNTGDVSDVEAPQRAITLVKYPKKPYCIRKFYSQVCSAECPCPKLPNHIWTSWVHPWFEQARMQQLLAAGSEFYTTML